MHQKILIVLDENDQIIEQIPCDGTNSSQQRQLEKETKKRYSGQKVVIRCGYKGVSEELYQKTKALLEKYSDVCKIFEKDRPEFKHLGYNMRNK